MFHSWMLGGRGVSQSARMKGIVMDFEVAAPGDPGQRKRDGKHGRHGCLRSINNPPWYTRSLQRRMIYIGRGTFERNKVSRLFYKKKGKIEGDILIHGHPLQNAQSTSCFVWES